MSAPVKSRNEKMKTYMCRDCRYTHMYEPYMLRHRSRIHGYLPLKDYREVVYYGFAVHTLR